MTKPSTQRQDRAETPEERRQRYRENLQGEVDGVALYEAMAAAERNPQRADLFRQLAAAESRHAEHWRQYLCQAGEEPLALRPTLRARLLTYAIRRLGSRVLLPLVNSLETRDSEHYAGQPEAGRLSADERTHAAVIAQMAGGPAVSGGPAAAERWHRSTGSGTLRAAVFGANDGLVSNLSLVMGVAGADPGNAVVVLAGVAGLLAGAFSMAVGEYVSMRAQREAFEREIALEAAEIEEFPEEEQEELALIYQAKGVPRDQAQRLAEVIMSQRDTALDTKAREELGIDPSELGSPWGAALSSLFAFSLGAVVPLVPFLIGGGVGALAAALGLAALALAGMGAAIALFTGRSLGYGSLRQVVLGMAAAGVTYAIGSAVGAGTGV